MTAESGVSFEEALRAALTAAIGTQQPSKVAALRLALAAIENAGAVPPKSARRTGGCHIAAGVEGLGAGEAPRRTVTEEEALRLVREELLDLRRAADLYEVADQTGAARPLREQARVLSEVLRQRGQDRASPAAPPKE